MRIADIMTDKPRYIHIDTTVAQAAQIMRDDDIGFVPVEQEDKMVGMLTDRDITIRAVAAGENPDRVTAATIMTPDVEWLYDDQDINDAKDVMEAKQVRRLPIVNRDKRLVGMLSLGDLYAKLNQGQHTLANIAAN